MDKLPPFLFSTIQDGEVILRTQYPFYLATIRKFDDYETMAMTIAKEEPMAYATIPERNIAITFAGTMGKAAATTNLNQEIEQVILAMKDYYINHL